MNHYFSLSGQKYVFIPVYNESDDICKGCDLLHKPKECNLVRCYDPNREISYICKKVKQPEET